MKAISIKNLSKTYKGGVQALRHIDLDVSEGDFFALLGANGAGKTTVISILTGLVRKSSGSVNIHGYDLDREGIRIRQLIGVVPQEINFNLFEKVNDIIVNQAGYFGIPKKEAQPEAEIILKRLRLWEKRDIPSRALSGGMKRRLMIARALISRPKLLILDEPTAGVDVELRHSMWDFLREINAQGITILLTTHYLEEVERLCNKAAMIKEGEIITHDKVSNLLKAIQKETLVIHVDKVPALDAISRYRPKIIDDKTFEVEFEGAMFDRCLRDLTALKMQIEGIRPKINRLEKLFFHIIEQK